MRHLTLILCAVLLTGCQTAPKSPEQTIAASYVAVETLAEATAIAYVDGYITIAQKEKIKQSLNMAIKYLHMGERLLADGSDPSNYTKLATNLLDDVAKYLRESKNE